MSELWTIRPYDAQLDEGGVVFLWLKSYAHSPFGRARGAHVDGSDAERAYWKEHREIVMRLLSKAETRILCDRDSPGVIWAFACVEPPSVFHYAVTKRKFKEFTDEMFRALLGSMVDGPAVYTHDPSGTGLRTPSRWTYNPSAVMGAS